METQILSSLLSRPGMSGQGDLLKDMIADSIMDIKNYLNYAASETLPAGCITAVKELTLIRFNRSGTEGIQSESQASGGSTTYTDILPDGMRRTIRRYRRLPR